MGTHQHRHDTAVAAATALLEMVGGALMEAEWRDFHEEAVRIVYAALVAYDEFAKPEAARLSEPSRN